MKKLMILVFAAVMSSFAAAQAGSTASGTLSVSATVTGSISLVFNTDTAGGLPLTSGNGTSAASLAFGNVSAFGTLANGNITRTVAANTFTVSTPVDVFVSKFNSNSATYRLTAQLVTPDAVNTWSVGGVAVSNATAATVTTTGAYASNNALAVAITIPFTSPSGTSISNQINYTATSN